ncbi:hypothetical protein [Microbacterium atlanticum]|uniref:hypothetical protein n=1 Tax=Microbacterium atlanticum TaxID=2782168 RepID=UPI001888F67C|nr:hypothetical protein [Microbacterium atlanticum]
MSTPTDSPLEELRALRERAYGPAADIEDDPAALARLQELQAREQSARAAAGHARTTPGAAVAASAAADGPRAAAPGGVTRAPDAPDAPDAVAAVDAVTAPAAAADVDAGSVATADGSATTAVPAGDRSAVDDEPAAPTRPWWRQRIPLLWAGSVIAGVLLGVVLTLGLQAIDSGRIAVLREDPDGEWPSSWFGSRPSDGLVFEEFHGLSVLVFPQTFGPGGVQSCLYVVTEGDGGFGAGSCGAEAYPATASMEIDRLSPDALRDAFPDGTSLQFVHEGGAVSVYSQAPRLIQPTP